MSRSTILAAILVAALIPAAAVSAEEYDLASYLAKVEQSNTDLFLAKNDLQAAEETVKQARSALLPTVGFQGSYTRNLEDIMEPTAVAANANTPIAPGVYPFIYQDVDSNMDNEFTLGVGVSQKIFDAESLARYEQARVARTVRTQALEATRRGIRNAAKKLYTQAQLTASMVDVMETSERTAEETYRDIEKKYKVGLAKELDMLSAEVDWKSRIPKTAEAKKNAELVMMALKNLAGIPLTDEVHLTEHFDTLPGFGDTPNFETVLASRPDYGIQLLSRDIADIAKRASLASFLPSVSASFNYAYGGLGNGSSLTDYDYTAIQLGATITLPLYTGGYRLSLVKSAQIEQQRQNSKIAQKRSDIEQELRSLRLQMEEANKNLDSAKLTAETAQRAVKLAKIAFQNGMVTQLSVSDATTKLDQARLNVLNAQYQYLSAYYDWEQAIGSKD